MLTSTYIHIPSIGKTIEHKIWSSGIKTWSEFIEQQDTMLISTGKKETIIAGIDESNDRLDAQDFEFFANALPRSEHWRTYRHFSGSVAYVDIETTGLSPEYDDITVVGIYDGKDAKTYVRGIDLDDIVEELAKYELLITFNGARFDLPFIKQKYPQIEFNQLHIDLMYPLRRIGLSGGLKNIERTLEISRSDETTGIDGFEAVRLWRRYERGEKGALELLLEYNREDIVNLDTIIGMTYQKFVDNAFSVANC
ncbi:MAG: ribonuclease H-like domain-containing protein [Methanosarcinaceae archaeon]|nr:ribonuclease H-like domain-containing protein [Methanosarcinaceae archaeon]